jgi:hypothetical protein
VGPAASRKPASAQKPWWKRWVPQLPVSQTTDGPAVSVSVCLLCGKELKGETLYCSPAHELEHLQRIETENSQRMAKLRADVKEEQVVPADFRERWNDDLPLDDPRRIKAEKA